MVYTFKHLLSGPEERTVGFSCILPVLDRKPNGLTVWLHVLQVKHRKSRYGYAYTKGQTKALVRIYLVIHTMYVYYVCMYTYTACMTKRFSSSTLQDKIQKF